jgi:hypothetical protein
MSPSAPSSRPIPLSFHPPKGACRSVVSLTLTPTAPASTRSADLGAIDRRLFVEVGDERVRALAHPRPVLDGRANLVQHADEVAAERVARLGLAVDLDVHD